MIGGKWNARKPVRRRDNASHIGDGRLRPKKIETKALRAYDLKEKVLGNVLVTTLPFGTTTENVNLYRYIRSTAYQEISDMQGYLQIPLEKIPIDKICLAVLQNVLDDIEFLICTTVDSELIDKKIIILEGAKQ